MRKYILITLFCLKLLIILDTFYLLPKFFLSAPNQNAGGNWGIYVHTYIFNITSMSFSDMVIYFNHLRIAAIQMSRFFQPGGISDARLNVCRVAKRCVGSCRRLCKCLYACVCFVCNHLRVMSI